MTSLKTDNHDLQDRVNHLERYSTSLQRLEEAVNDSEAANKTVKNLGRELICLCDKLEDELKSNAEKDKVIKTITLVNKDLNANIDETMMLLEKSTKEHREASNHVIEIKKRSTRNNWH